MEITPNHKILCVCNYGQVRSATMAIALRERGFPNTFAAGAMNNSYEWLDAALNEMDLVIVCNHIELGELYSRENFGKTDEEKLAIAKLFTEKYKDKTIVSPIGRDVWGAPPNKPELRAICDEWLNSLQG